MQVQTSNPLSTFLFLPPDPEQSMNRLFPLPASAKLSAVYIAKYEYIYIRIHTCMYVNIIYSFIYIHSVKKYLPQPQLNVNTCGSLKLCHKHKHAITWSKHFKCILESILQKCSLTLCLELLSRKAHIEAFLHWKKKMAFCLIQGHAPLCTELLQGISILWLYEPPHPVSPLSH